MKDQEVAASFIDKKKSKKLFLFFSNSIFFLSLTKMKVIKIQIKIIIEKIKPPTK